MKIWFAHAVNIENSGDGASTPYNYFKEYFDQYECTRIDVTRLEEYDLIDSRNINLKFFEKVKEVIEDEL